MLVREFRGSDLPQLIRLQEEGFPEENALYGMRVEELAPIVRRLERPHVRFLFGLLRALGRPVLRFPVVEDEGKVVATSVLSFGPRMGYVSMVMVDPAFRRRGYARRLLEVCRAATHRRGKPYVVLDVLANNGPALALYEAIGYRRLRNLTVLSKEGPFDGVPDGPAASVRAFVRQDTARLVEFARQQLPATIAEVLPPDRGALTGGGWSSRMFASATAAWVLDTGRGADAFVSASTTPVTTSAHLTAPIVGPDVPDELADGLLRTALTWVRERGAPRVVVHLPEENRRGRELLQRSGFVDALSTLTLYRPAA